MAVPTQPLEGYFYDELSKIRVLEPETAKTTEEMKEECKEFVDSKKQIRDLHTYMYVAMSNSTPRAPAS